MAFSFGVLALAIARGIPPRGVTPHNPALRMRHPVRNLLMPSGTQRRSPEIAFAAALAFALVTLSFLWQGHHGFSLWDEGFLWYGVQRVVAGEVPIRDFMAYDPARYYWSAAFAYLLGNDGIIVVRIAAAVFQAIGLWVAITLLFKAFPTRARGRLAFVSIAALLLLAWMLPRHKLFDVSASIFLVGLLCFLLSRPQPRRYFIAGLGVGLIAVLGRNHGIYGVAASLLAMAWQQSAQPVEPREWVRRVVLWAAGVAAGFLPVLLMMIVVPGFAAAFWESVRFLFENSATNLPIPVPWPWTVPFATLPWPEALRATLLGLFFLLPLVFGVCGLVALIVRQRTGKPTHPVIVAAICLALPYAHFALSRADAGHLAQGIFPTLIGVLAVIGALPAFPRWCGAALLTLAGIWTVLPYHPGWQCRPAGACSAVVVSDSRVWVEPGTARDIALLRELDQGYAPGKATFFVAPFWPGAYALLHKPSPTWEIYPLFPRTAAFERAEIARFDAQQPRFALITDMPMDGREDRRFRNTHPLLYQHILANYRPIPVDDLPDYQIYVAKPSK